MDGAMRTGLKILHVICFLLLLGSGDFQVRGLTVTGKDVPIEALRGENVTIPCLLSGVPIPLNLQILSVTWTLRLRNGTEFKVYQFEGSHHQSSRSGSHMNDRNLQQGNASLSVSNIQITDEGDYRCFVIATPDAGTATSTLHVSVKPQTNLVYRRIIEVGFPGSASCKVSNFYPEEVKIRWVKHSKGITTHASLDEDVTLTMPLRNSDETFNVTSVLTVRPASRDEPGDVFSCIVTHRSLKKEITLNFTMPRWNPAGAILFAFLLLYTVAFLTILWKKYLRKEWRIWMKILRSAIYISSVILIYYVIYFMVDFGLPTWIYFPLPCLSITFLILLTYYMRFFWKYFKIGDITVSEISEAQRFHHKKRMILTCQITNFRQKEIHINVYLKRRKDKKHLMASWESTDWTSSNNSNVLPLLEKGAKRRTLLPVEMEVKMTKSLIGMYTCLCSITMSPNKDTDNGAVLAVEVEHSSLKKPISVYRTLNVYSKVEGIPVVSAIRGDMWIPHMKKTTLLCQITKFKLKKIHINLYLKRHNDIKNHLIHSWVSVDRPLGKDNTAAGHHSGDPIEEDSLLEDVVNDTFPEETEVEMEVEMTETEDRSYKCDCRISLTPNIDTDDGAILTVEVDHAALEWPIYKYHFLNVIKGDKPSLWRRWRKHVIK